MSICGFAILQGTFVSRKNLYVRYDVHFLSHIASYVLVNYDPMKPLLLLQCVTYSAQCPNYNSVNA